MSSTIRNFLTPPANTLQADETRSEEVEIVKDETHVEKTQVTAQASSSSTSGDVYTGPSSTTAPTTPAIDTDKADAELKEGADKLAEGSKAIGHELKEEGSAVAHQVAASASDVGKAVRDQAGNIGSGALATASGLGKKAAAGVHAIGHVAIAEPARAAARGVAAARTNIFVARPNEIVSSKVPAGVFLGSAAGLVAYALTSATVVIAGVALPAILGSLMGISALFMAGRYINRAFSGPAIPENTPIAQVTTASQGLQVLKQDFDGKKTTILAQAKTELSEAEADYVEINEKRTLAEIRVRSAALLVEAIEASEAHVAEMVQPEVPAAPAPARAVIRRETVTEERTLRVVAASVQDEFKTTAQLKPEATPTEN